MGKAFWGLGLAVLALIADAGPAQAQTIFANGFEESCTADTDGDRLVNCQEANLGTSITLPDTDGDGLADGDEVLGTLGGLNLPAMGVNPRRKDLLVEMDWTEEAFECPQHSHRVTAQTIDEVRIFFAATPISNPDGSTGINFIADYGQGGAFTGGNFIAIPDGITTPLEAPYFNYKAANFAPNRRGYFRYQLQGHRWAYGTGSSGWASIQGDDGVVTLNCKTDVPGWVRNTIIHEFGHNLGLHHGGNSGCNYKPNYNSLMNYNHQFYGLDMNCDRTPDGVNNIGYSDGSRSTLDHQAMNESAGICPPGHPQHKAIDWNGNGTIDPGTYVYGGVLTDCGANFNPVTDFNDYAALLLPPKTPQNGGAAPPAEASGSCPPIPEP